MSSAVVATTAAARETEQRLRWVTRWLWREFFGTSQTHRRHEPSHTPKAATGTDAYVRRP
jgi:hypothetical protein